MTWSGGDSVVGEMRHVTGLGGACAALAGASSATLVAHAAWLYLVPVADQVSWPRPATVTRSRSPIRLPARFCVQPSRSQGGSSRQLPCWLA